MAVTNYVATGITVDFSTLTGELLDVKKSGEKADQVDVTHQISSNKWRQFKSGLLDGGEFTLTLHFDPDAIVPTMGTSGTMTVVWPNGATKKFQATANLSGRGDSATLGDKMTQDLTFKISGAPNYSYT
jgi:hypothetical protein